MMRAVAFCMMILLAGHGILRAEGWLVPFGRSTIRHGAAGSAWRARTALINRVPFSFTLTGPFSCLFECDDSLHIPASSIQSLLLDHESDVPGTIVYAPDAADIHLSTIISANGSPGVTLEGVELSNFIRGIGVMVPIVLPEGSRAALRLFQSPDERASFVVRFYSNSSGHLLREILTHTSHGRVPFVPSYAEVQNFPAPEIEGGSMTVEVTPLEADVSWWGYVSVTAGDAVNVVPATYSNGAAPVEMNSTGIEE